jgi:hypothetical protein
MTSEQIYKNFWGLAIGGNSLKEKTKRMYNQLVELYSNAYGMNKRFHIDKKTVIQERIGNV